MDAERDDADPAIELVARKWLARLLRTLEPGPLRYSQLRRALPRISSSALVSTLRRMEQTGLIARQVDSDELPPAVSYELTHSARELLVPLDALTKWGRTHLAEEPRSPP
jgi:DNA-binding HxlR family transcriptional regulator